MENGISGDKLERFMSLQEMKKEIDQELAELKEEFHEFFDESVGKNKAGEYIHGGYKLQRQIRKTEKYDNERAVKRLEELAMDDLIETVRRPDKQKVHAAVELGLLRSDQLADVTVKQYSRVLVVRQV